MLSDVLSGAVMPPFSQVALNPDTILSSSKDRYHLTIKFLPNELSAIFLPYDHVRWFAGIDEVCHVPHTMSNRYSNKFCVFRLV